MDRNEYFNSVIDPLKSLKHKFHKVPTKLFPIASKGLDFLAE